MGGDHRAGDPLAPREFPSDFQAARDAAQRVINERHRTKNSPEVAAALIVAQAIMALAEAIREAARGN